MKNRISGLPLQNVLAVGALLYAGEFATACMERAGFGLPVAATALGWTALVLIARWAARRLLRKARGSPGYGFWMMAAAGLMTGLLEGVMVSGNQDPWPAVGIRFFSTFILLLATAPWFVRKEQFSTLLLR